MSESVESRLPGKKKQKCRTVEMEIVAESSDRIPPRPRLLPLHLQRRQPCRRPFASSETPAAPTAWSSSSPPCANVDFVGTSYSGEAAGPQIFTYAIGVLDKDSQTLKIVPIAANKIIRLEPKVIRAPDAEDATAEEGISTERSRADLTSLYGMKKNKSKDKVWKTLKQQQHDPSTRENLDNQASDADINNEPFQEVKGTMTRNIPPYDSSAVVPEKACLLDEIILKAEWDYLTDILEFIQSGADAKSGFWQENGYPSYVITRLHKLKEIQRFMRMFVDPVSDTVSAEHKELLIGYILVLTLIVDKFVTDATEIAKDSGVPHGDLPPYYRQLGCKDSLNNTLGKYLITLPVPLQFKEQKKRRRRRQ